MNPDSCYLFLRVLGLMAVFPLAGFASGAAPAPSGADTGWEKFADGSMGQETEFRGVDGTTIPAYIRKPGGPGPFPVIMLLHGGRYGKDATMGMGRSVKSPAADFIKAGWAVYSIDYRPTEKIAIEPLEFDDSVEAVKKVRQYPFIDPARVGLLGGSHGAQVSSRLASRVDVSGAVLCAPAAIDLIEVKKAFGRGEKLVSILNKMVGDMETKLGAKAEEIEKDPAKYGYSSALTEAAQVRCPILLVNGRNDDNSPISILEVYIGKLRAAGKQVETYFPDNGPHGFYFGRPEIPEWQEATRREVAFFQKVFAQGKTADPAPAPTARTEAPAAPTTATQAPAQKARKNGGVPPDYGSIDWVDPNKTAPEGSQYNTFHSATINGGVSYLIYLPPDYDKQTDKRYPVLYELPASGQTPISGADVVKRMDAATRAGRIDPLIIVMVNGLRGNTMYSDSKDGKHPLETVIIKDLIPHIDATYRTVASRAGRALDGFSMGGFGAAHLGFKYPEVFGVISIMAPPLLGPELKQPRPAMAWSRLFPAAMGGDLDYWRQNDPFDLAVKNAGAMRDRMVIRIVCHVEEENWLAPQCEKLHELLMQHTIAHQFAYLSNVKGHNRGQCWDTLGDSGVAFFGSGFAYLQKPLQPRPPVGGAQKGKEE